MSEPPFLFGYPSSETTLDDVVNEIKKANPSYRAQLRRENREERRGNLIEENTWLQKENAELKEYIKRNRPWWHNLLFFLACFQPIVFVFLFGGDPDVMDAIIDWISSRH